jgi:hypothetical protein
MKPAKHPAPVLAATNEDPCTTPDICCIQHNQRDCQLQLPSSSWPSSSQAVLLAVVRPAWSSNTRCLLIAAAALIPLLLPRWWRWHTACAVAAATGLANPQHHLHLFVPTQWRESATQHRSGSHGCSSTGQPTGLV